MINFAASFKQSVFCGCTQDGDPVVVLATLVER